MTDERQKQPEDDWKAGAPEFLEVLKDLKGDSSDFFQYRVVLDAHLVPANPLRATPPETKPTKKNKKRNKTDAGHSAARVSDAGSSEYFLTVLRTNLPLGRGDFLPTLNGRAYALVRSHATKEVKIARYDPEGEYFSGPVYSIPKAIEVLKRIGADVLGIYAPCRKDSRPASAPKRQAALGS